MCYIVFRYIKAAREWSAWVNCSPDERYGFYADTLHDSDKVEEIGKELRKISCFNCILSFVKFQFLLKYYVFLILKKNPQLCPRTGIIAQPSVHYKRWS